MKKRLFPLLIALSALAVSGSAAFYSVFGLSKLFAGASFEVIIMAGSLEFAKLVVASLLYQYWGTINKILKGYLMIACFILMVITSGGIYGFLSGAYQSTATQSELLDKSLAILEQKQVRFEETKEDLIIEKTQLNQSISDLRVSLSNPQQVSWYDKNSETVITSTSSSARRALQSELKTTITDRDNINIKIEAVMDSINKTDIALLDKEVSNEAESELGPLKYLSQTTGYPMEQVVNWFLLLIIFVFDPLAIALVISANMAFAQIRKPKEEDDTEEYFKHRNKAIEKVTMSKPEGLDFNKPYTLDEIKSAFTKESEILDEDGEKRMNIIGQNGNDGLHYDKEEEKESILDDEYFTDLEHYIKFTKEEDDPLGLTYPDFVDLHYPPKNEVIYESDIEDEVELEDYTGELDRLTDTTQTLIVEKLEDNSEEPTEDEEQDEKPTKVLRYTKDR
tara:strand:- start:8033 stop:9385 length:1353 start_codon:yes stop_codon:yes gene_type:complete